MYIMAMMGVVMIAMKVDCYVHCPTIENYICMLGTIGVLQIITYRIQKEALLSLKGGGVGVGLGEAGVLTNA